MALNLKSIQAINEIAEVLYPFLPGKAHPFANQEISFEAVANSLNLAKYWSGGSKLPAISQLLRETAQHQPVQFCTLINNVVRTGLTYRQNKGSPVTRDEIDRLNYSVEKVGFKISELWDAAFLATLPRPAGAGEPDGVGVSTKVREDLKNDLVKISSLPPQKRGYAFERLLGNLFEAFGLAPRTAFRLVGEQIDGSIQFQGETYLVEAKWHSHRVAVQDLLVFSGKIDGKALWSRGLFISYSGFTEDGLQAFTRGRPTNLICIDGLDFHYALEGKLDLCAILERKARRAAESNEAFVRVTELFPSAF